MKELLYKDDTVERIASDYCSMLLMKEMKMFDVEKMEATEEAIFNIPKIQESARLLQETDSVKILVHVLKSRLKDV